ncbi:MAG: hypothetical protein IJ865_07640 [Clostridia bacterium]|nr:hypothetical protein [Clostridia bacterium]
MEQDWIPTWFSAMHTYAFQTADLLGAQCQIISQSGWGLRCGWDNHPDHTLPSIYDAACAIASWDEKWDFAAHPMDAVIVNLGTNDDGAFHQPPYVDPVSGETFQNKLLADGSYDEACLQAIMDAQVSFLRHLRELHPTAYLFWCYGMIGHNLEACLEAGVRRYSEESGDTRVRYLSLPETAQEDYGARAHPGREAHKKAATFLARELEFLSKGDGEA